MDWYPKFQMNYTSIVDLIQVFANEYCVPGSLVLLIGTLKLEENEKVRSIFNFIDSELIVVDSIKGPTIDIPLNSNGDFPVLIYTLVWMRINENLLRNIMVR